MTRKSVLLPCVVAATFAALPAAADSQTVYKLVDKKGKVTYAEKAPKDYDGQVIRMEIDLKANTAVLPKPGQAPTAFPTLELSPQEVRRIDADLRLARAEEALEAAKKALKDGQEPTEDEVTRLGKAGGGTRPVFTEAYQNRIKALEEDVKNAEAEVERARKLVRQSAVD
jgi:hypothetical protein